MFKWLGSYLKKYRLHLGFALILVLLVAGLNLVNPLLSGQLVDEVILGKNINLLWKLLGIMFVTVFIKTGLRYLYQMIYEYISQSTIKAMRQDLFVRIQRMDFSYHDRTKTGDLMAHMTGDIDAVRHFIAWVIYQVMENGTMFIISIVSLFFINAELTLVLLAVTPFIAFAAISLSRKVLPTFSRIRDQFSQLNSVVQENIAGNRVIKAFVREKYEIERFQKENDEYRKRNLESAEIWGTYIPLIEFFSGLLQAIMILLGGIFIIRGTLTLGQLVVFNSLIWAITNPLRMVGWLVNDVQRFSASCRRLEELSRVDAAIKSSAKLPELRESAGSAITGNLEFRGVGFSYQEDCAENRVLEDLNFVVKAGQTIGVVGATGSGKTSLARLLCRFYDPSVGSILLDGKDLKDYDLETLRSNIGITMQDVFLFSDTLEGNISFGDPQMAMAQVLKASEMANAHEFIKDLPETYDTIVGERGVGLSGGQRQRVALARLLAKSPPVMILDDTTSAVDVETEAQLQEAIRSLHGRCTLFIIAHRISSVKHADQIFVLDQGRIVERGTHNELLSLGGIYAGVCRHQAGLED